MPAVESCLYIAQHNGSKHATAPSCNMVRKGSFTGTQHVPSNILCALRLS